MNIVLGIAMNPFEKNASLKEFLEFLKEKLQGYSNPKEARDWLNNNLSRVKALFENYTLSDFIFEPFKEVFDTPAKTIDKDIYSVITKVAIINAVLAGLPGKMGVGVYVVMAMEGWMAFCIAKHVELPVKKPSDIWKYFGLLAASAGFILYGFRTILGFAFSLFSVVPGINPLILAEILVTDLVGVLFWIGFIEAKETGSFIIPKRMILKAGTTTRGLFKHQLNILKNVLSPKNIKTVAERIWGYFKGEFPVDMKTINGETFATGAMAYLMAGQYEKLEGPLGDTFLEAIRLRWSAQFSPDATVEDIATRFREYDTDQLEGAINTIKGKMFEIMVTKQENLDGDQWQARMHTDESFPGSDIVFTNEETSEQIEVSLKAVSQDNTEIIERALVKYPDKPIMTTDEVAELYQDNNMVFGSGLQNEELHDITEKNIDELLAGIKPLDEHQVVIGGVVVGTVAALWPFVVAYLRGRISKNKLEKVFEQTLGKSGVALASRLSYAIVFGPLFAWYLLARGVKGIVTMAEPESTVYFEFMRSENKH
jgi:hypothetical protein